MTSEPAERSALWALRISEQESSGQSIREYCLDHALKESTFYAWRKRLRRMPATAPEPLSAII